MKIKGRFFYFGGKDNSKFENNKTYRHFFDK